MKAIKIGFVEVLACAVVSLFLSSCIAVNGQVKDQVKEQRTGSSNAQSLSAGQIARLYMRSLVILSCDDRKGNLSLGSGFFVGDSGYVVTNFHLIRGMNRGTVTLFYGGRSGQRIAIQKVVFFDRFADLAVIKIEGIASPPQPALKFAKNLPEIGSSIYVLGNPQGFSGTITPGIVSSRQRKIDGVEMLQISAPVSPGSSGGPVLNTSGEVVGVVVGSIEGGQNLNFAISTPVVREFLSRSVNFENVVNEYNRGDSETDSWLVAEIPFSVSSFEGGVPSGTRATLTETTDWLRRTLIGRSALSHYTNNQMLLDRTLDLSFSGCIMTLKTSSEVKGYPKVIETLTANFSVARDVKGWKNKDGDTGVQINFNKPVSKTHELYLEDGSLDQTKFETYWHQIVIQDDKLYETTASAFNNVIRLCRVK